MLTSKKPSIIIFMTAAAGMPGIAFASHLPTDLARGEAPLLFTSSEGADENSMTLLRDGQGAVGDDIWLWVPSLDGSGHVDLASTGQIFRVWDSGPEAGPDGNDDNDNGMRGMDFDQTTGTFLVSYEDTTTTGFSFGGIKDGALMRMTPGSISNGAITSHTFTELYDEGINGTAGFMSDKDISGMSIAGDGTLIWSAAGTQTLQNTNAGTTSAGSNSLLRTEGLSSTSPRNIGDDVFYEASAAGNPEPFPSQMLIGQLRGVDELANGDVLVGTSGEYHNRVESGGVPIGVDLAFNKADIASIDLFTREAEVVYPGNLFFQTPAVGDAEILDFDILDSAFELQALINVLGADSDAGLALAAHVIPSPASVVPLLSLGAIALRRRRA